MLRDGDKKKERKRRRRQRRQKRIECRELPALRLITAHCHRSNRDKLLNRKKKVERETTTTNDFKRERREIVPIQISHRHALTIETFPRAAHFPARPPSKRDEQQHLNSIPTIRKDEIRLMKKKQMERNRYWGGIRKMFRKFRKCFAICLPSTHPLIVERHYYLPMSLVFLSGRKLSANYCN